MSLKDWLAKRLEPFLQRLEDRFEQGGHFRKAQQLRRKQHDWRRYQPQVWEQFDYYLAAHHGCRYFIQEEACLQVKHESLFQQLEESPSVVDTLVTEMESIQQKLQDLNRSIWRGERDLQAILRGFPDGPLKRALYARHRKNDSHRSTWLQTECASVGGCCERGCGCCLRPRSSKRPSRAGHCTSACKCCEDARGFRIDFLGTGVDPMIVTFGLEEADVDGRGSSYTKSAINAYIWGL